MIAFFKFLTLDIRNILFDLQFYFSGLQKDFSSFLFFNRFKIYLNRFNDLRKYFLKKYVYTIKS